METKMMSNSLRGLGWACGLAFAVASAVAGCGGHTDGPIGGSESHFLAYCVDVCGDGLDCIAGVCTRGCVVEEDDCTDLAPRAECTSDSIEPGAVAVCDVACSNDGDCGALGSDHGCDGGFCRKPPRSGGGSGGTGTGSGGAPDGAACDVDGTQVPSGSEVENPNGCGYCTCEDGEVLCDERGCSDLIGVPPCPEGDLEGDPIDVTAYHPEGDVFVVDVAHSGGCEEHSYAMCYRNHFAVSDPPTSTLHLTHDANGDACEAYPSSTLRFDLSAVLAEFVGGDGVMFGWSPSEGSNGVQVFSVVQAWDCQQRTEVAQSQVEYAAEAHRTCDEAADCRRVNSATSCYVGCGAIVNAVGEAEFEASLESISLNVCGDCPGAVPTCAEQGEIDCVEGLCVEVFP
jgi:hypothetical protein